MEGNGYRHHHFLNAEKFIQEAIDSVLAQTFQDGSYYSSTTAQPMAAVELPWRYAEQY